MKFWRVEKIKILQAGSKSPDGRQTNLSGRKAKYMFKYQDVDDLKVAEELYEYNLMLSSIITKLVRGGSEESDALVNLLDGLLRKRVLDISEKEKIKTQKEVERIADELFELKLKECTSEVTLEEIDYLLEVADNLHTLLY